MSIRQEKDKDRQITMGLERPIVIWDFAVSDSLPVTKGANSRRGSARQKAGLTKEEGNNWRMSRYIGMAKKRASSK